MCLGAMSARADESCQRERPVRKSYKGGASRSGKRCSRSDEVGPVRFGGGGSKRSNRILAGLAFCAGLLTASGSLADDVLPKDRKEALAMEAKDALPLTRFYDPPSPL